MQAALEDKGIKHALNLVGNQHKYQIRAAIMIALQYLGPSLFLAYVSFFDQSPIFLCRNKDGFFSRCYENSGGCDSQSMSPETPDSPVFDFGLYCDRAYMRSWTQLCVPAIIGAALFSFVSDFFGRKKAMFSSYALTALSLFMLASASINHVILIAMFRLAGLGIGGYISISITYLSEIGSEKFGKVAAGAVLLVLAVGGLIMTGLIHAQLRWRLLILYFIGVPAVLILSTFNYLDETPMFLYRNKEIGKTLETLEKMAATNNKLADLGANIEANGIFRFTDDSEAERSKRYVQRWHYLQILKHPQLKCRVLVYALIRSLASLPFWASFYYVLTQNEKNLAVLAFASIAEIFGGLFSLKFSVIPTRSGLKGGLATVFIASLAFFVANAFGCQDIPGCKESIVFPLVFLCMLFSLGLTRRWVYNLGNELFPIEVRSQCNGIGEIFAQSAGPLIPVIFKLATKENSCIPWLIVSVAVLACLGLSFLLPKEDLTTLEKGAEIELNLDENPKLDSQPLIAN